MLGLKFIREEGFRLSRVSSSNQQASLNSEVSCGQLQSNKNKFRFLIRDWQLYAFLVPGILLTILFHYVPMYGILYAFQDFNIYKGFMNSPWVGLKHFKVFTESYYFWQLIGNTVRISLTGFVFTFPLPIILALLLNELKSKAIKKTVQTISYFPHFISTVVVVGMLVQFTTPSDGIVNQFIKMLGGAPIDFMVEEGWFLPLYVITGIWQSVGWSSIIYLAALSSIDVEQYEAAIVDGASRFKQMLYISIPGILPTITILLILAIGSLFSVSFEKVLLMQNPLTLETSDVLNTYIYRTGLLNGEYSLSTAVNLFQTVINAVLLIAANTISRKTSENSLW